MKFFVAATVTLALCGCGPRLISQTDDTVSFTVNTSRLAGTVDEASAKASSYCRGRGYQSYTLQSMEEVRNKAIATYRCK